MLSFLSLLGVFLSVILLLFNARKFKSSIYLGLFFLLLSLYGGYQYALLYSKSAKLLSFLLFNISLTASPVYLIGPMIYLYIRSVLTDNSKLKAYDFLHFLPAVLYFIVALPNGFVPWQDHMEVAKAVVGNGEFLMYYQPTIFNKIVPNYYMYISRPVLILIYATWSTGLLIHHLLKKKGTVFLSQQFMSKWMFLLLGLIIFLCFSQIWMITKSFKMHFTDLDNTFDIIRLVSALGLSILLVSPFFFPSILYGMPVLPESVINLRYKSERQKQTNEQPNGNKTTFELEYLNSMQQKIDVCMEKHQPYLQADFNLAYLSALIQVPVHHLAYFFREVKHEHFTDYRNSWRIEHAKSLMNEGEASDLTLEAIGLKVGFSNRNAFRTAFKKIEGCSPVEYSFQTKN